MPFDVATIKEQADLLDLVGLEGLRKVAGTDGGEYAGPCPQCGGEDRFHVAAAGWWFCRQCHPKRGDAIEYLQWRDGLDFKEACAALGGDSTAARPRQVRRPRPRVRHAEAPATAWQDRARAFVAYAQGELWGNAEALAYLRGRGLHDETIRAAGLGWNPKTLFDKDVARWGMDPREHKAVWIPAGWVIPCELGDELQYVKVRRRPEDLAEAEAWNQSHPDTKPHSLDKYINVTGSKKAGVIYGLERLQGLADLILCEGELNALILWQALGGYFDVVSVGDAGNGPAVEALGMMRRAGRWWLAFDPDKAGQKGVAQWLKRYGRSHAMPWPWTDRGEKYDINDAYLDGENLASWAIGAIGPKDPEERQRWAIVHLNRLDGAAFDAGADTTDPALRAWLALYNQAGWAPFDLSV